jgi:hypothetical protein
MVLQRCSLRRSRDALKRLEHLVAKQVRADYRRSILLAALDRTADVPRIRQQLAWLTP